MGKFHLLLFLALLSFLNIQAQNGPQLDVFSDSEDTVYVVVETMPEFPEGNIGLMRYLASVTYPLYARAKNMEGIPYVRFIIEKDGFISNIEIDKSSGHDLLDEATMLHVKRMPQWQPGYQDGKPVRVQYIVHVQFKMS